MVNKSAEILCVGTELLMGSVVNTNATYIASKLASIGIGLYHQGVVGDNTTRLEEEVKNSLERSDIVITTGGLGPTYDDLTKETVAGVFNRELVLDQKVLDDIYDIFNKSENIMTENNKKQAYVPKGAVVFYNKNGTAPGLAISEGGKTVILLPGPPSEMIPMMDDQVVPYLAAQSGGIIKSHMICFYGIGESALETELKDIMISYTNPTIAPYAKPDEVNVRVSAFAENNAEADKLLEPVIEIIKQRLGQYIYDIDSPSIQNSLVNNLKEKGMTIALAESCSGGYTSKRITEIDGSSKVYKLGICAYSNKAKIDILGVSAEDIDKYTEVSEQIAIQMADGIRRLADSDIGIATTGYAGPTGLDIGLVFIGVSMKDKSYAIECRLGRGYSTDRELIQYRSASKALHIALMEIIAI